jgi:hypothetical protein
MTDDRVLEHQAACLQACSPKYLATEQTKVSSTQQNTASDGLAPRVENASSSPIWRLCSYRKTHHNYIAAIGLLVLTHTVLVYSACWDSNKMHIPCGENSKSLALKVDGTFTAAVLWSGVSVVCQMGREIKVAPVFEPITVSARSRAWTVFAHSNAGTVGSNHTQGMDVCMCLFCVYVVLCVGSGLTTGWWLVQGVLPSV